MRTIKKYQFNAICKADTNEQFNWGCAPYVIVDIFTEKKPRIQNMITSCLTLEEAKEEIKKYE